MKIFSISIQILLAVQSFSQNKIVKKEYYQAKVDSVKKLLANEKRDTVIINLHDKIAEFYLQFNSNEAIKLLEKNLLLSKKTGIVSKIYSSMFRLSFHYTLVGNSPKSVAILQELMRMTEKSDPINYSIAVCFLGRNYMILKD